MPQTQDSVRRSIQQHHMIRPGEIVVVGVSGGPDSLCLLHILRSLEEYSLVLHVAHVHHGLRGSEADDDAEAVRTQAAEWDLGCTIERVDVKRLAREHRLALEEAARRARYRFLSRVAEEVGARCIAVGHNADDQTETVLMHWIRGSGLAGLRGMLPVTPLSQYRLDYFPHAKLKDLGQRLVRPLLEVPRAEIEAYRASHGLASRFDRSNLDTTYFRNWLRHEVLPLLARHNPNVCEVIRRSARVLTEDYALLRSVLASAWPGVVSLETSERIVFDLEKWRALPTSLQRSTIREAAYRLRRTLRDVSFVHVENALAVARDGATGAESTLPQGLMLRVGYQDFAVEDAGAEPAIPNLPLLRADDEVARVSLSGTTELPGSQWQLEISPVALAELPANWQANQDPWRAFLDAGVARGGLRLRTRRTGDRFCPLGMGGHSVSLSDFLTNQKVPRSVRARLPLLVGERGIVWVCGQRIDEYARVRDTTETTLLVRFVRKDCG